MCAYLLIPYYMSARYAPLCMWTSVAKLIHPNPVGTFGSLSTSQAPVQTANTVTIAPISVQSNQSGALKEASVLVGESTINDEVLGIYSELSDSDKEVAIIACHIGRLTVLKEVVTTDRSGSVGKSPKASSNIPEAVFIGDIFGRGGSNECASNGSEDLAGEARHRDSVEQYGSVVSFAKCKACERSLSTTAVWIGVQCIGSINVVVCSLSLEELVREEVLVSWLMT